MGAVMAASTMIEVQDLGVTYGTGRLRIDAVKGVCFKVGAGSDLEAHALDRIDPEAPGPVGDAKILDLDHGRCRHHSAHVGSRSRVGSGLTSSSREGRQRMRPWV